MQLAPCFFSRQNSSSFSSDINKSDIKTVLKTVADWQIILLLTHDPADWTNGALYAGMVQWAAIAGDDKYYEWLKGISEKNGWTRMDRKESSWENIIADDYCVGQTYIELYRKYKDKKMIRPMREYLDQIIKNPATGDLKFENNDLYWSTQRWSWCDALFMGPTVWAKMANVTGRKIFLDFMYHEYKATTDYLYDKEEDLYFRDLNYFTQKEANGQKYSGGVVTAGYLPVCR